MVGGHDGYGIGEGVITSIPFRRISQQILKQELQLYEIYQAQIASCDVEIDKCLASFDCQLIQVQITMNRNIGNESFLSWRKRLNLWAFIWLLNLKTQFEFLRRLELLAVELIPRRVRGLVQDMRASFNP